MTTSATVASKKASDNPIIVVQGAHWGSEAKGAICAALGEFESADIMVRTGTVNAGHTVYFRGFPHAMQQIPVGWVNPQTALYLGPGAYIHPDILVREIEEINAATGSDIRHRLYIDFRCGLHLPGHTTRAKLADRHHKMGATGKGCSEAVVDKIAGRGTDRGRLFKQWLDTNPDPLLLQGLNFVDTVAMLNSSFDEGAKVIIEGTQGTLLDLHIGPYPYTTHKQTQAANWLAECGLSPSLPYEVVSVCRTYPIRVAGNSGPMPGETSWVDLARNINRRLARFNLPPRVKEDSLQQFEEACKEVASEFIAQMADSPAYEHLLNAVRAHDLWRIEKWSQTTRESSPELQKFTSELHAEALHRLPGPVVEDLRHLFELTTVTKKLRRIAALDVEGLRYSCMLNRPSYLCLTFINYLYPEIWGIRSWMDAPIVTLEQVAKLCVSIQEQTGVPVRYVTTGPETKHVLDVRDIMKTKGDKADVATKSVQEDPITQ